MWEKAQPARPQIADGGDLALLVVVTVVLWPLLLAWATVKRPILSVPIAVYVGLVVWLGSHDSQHRPDYHHPRCLGTPRRPRPQHQPRRRRDIAF